MKRRRRNRPTSRAAGWRWPRAAAQRRWPWVPTPARGSPCSSRSPGRRRSPRAPCTIPRSWRPVSSAAATNCSATPGEAISPATKAISATASISARIVRCSSDGSLRPLSTTRPAPLSTSHRVTTMPRPPSPPVTMYGGAVANTVALREPSSARTSRSTNRRPDRQAITSSGRWPNQARLPTRLARRPGRPASRAGRNAHMRERG